MLILNKRRCLQVLLIGVPWLLIGCNSVTVVENGGNVTKTSRELGMARSTLRNYARLQSALVKGIALAQSTPDRAREITDRWYAVQHLATEKMTAKLEAGDAPLRDIAYSASVASTEYQNHALGRKGMDISVSVDARSVGLPAGMSVDEARQLAADLRGGEGSAAADVTPTAQPSPPSDLRGGEEGHAEASTGDQPSSPPRQPPADGAAAGE